MELEKRGTLHKHLHQITKCLGTIGADFAYCASIIELTADKEATGKALAAVVQEQEITSVLLPPLWGEEDNSLLQMLASCKCSPNDCRFPVSGGKETTSSLVCVITEERTNSLPPTAALPADCCQGVQRPTEIMAAILIRRL